MKRLMGLLVIAGALAAASLLAACGSDSSASTEPAGSTGSSGSTVSSAPEAAMAAGNSEAHGISVSGEGRASAAPDVAMLTLGASTDEDTVAEASSAVREAMDDLMASLEANGVQEKDIQTTQYSIYPEYDYRNEQRILTGYQVSHMVRVKVRDIDRAGEVIDDAVEAAGDLLQVQGIGFAIDDTSALRSEAREKAMADAQAKASELAELADVTLGKPTYITESSYTPGPYPYYDRGVGFAMEEAAPTEISPGELEVVVNVSVTYGIE
jgi:uncharacterized protein YggE